MKEKHFIRVEEAAEYLGVAKSHLYRLTKERLIKHYKSAGGRIIYFKIEDLDEYITHTYVTPMNELEKAVNYN